MTIIHTRPIDRQMHRAGLALFAILLGFCVASSAIPAQAAPNHVVADLSEDLVEITSGYHGTELLLFGAYRGMPGDDLILEVRGPSTDLLQRRKEQKAGIWVNVETVKWMAVPSFYHLFSTRPLTEIAGSEALGDARIGADMLGLRMAQAAGGNNGHGAGDDSVIGAPVAGTAAQTEGLARNMTRIGLWGTKSNAVATQQDMLYRTALSLPSNVPPGAYVIRVLHFRDGVAINESKTDMNVRKAGLSALIYRFAHDYSLFYGLFAIAFAVASGWLAAVAFRRG
ncbi:MAG: Uncharacterised protein [SAR116 cluster bacterium]|nr:MAG: Uncharacterised protein [SAR116 cluster bacterium]